jgi:glyoxylase-like metal-dependent hydrolase (beta-lactamase superfamily II)
VTAAEYVFGDAIPAPGESIEAAPGIRWIRMPLPFALDHINLWLLEDGDGWTIVDTGFGTQVTWDLWLRHFEGTMAGRPVKNVVVTHYHPDHLGSAAWLVERTGAPFWLTLGDHEWQVITVFGHAPEHAALYCASKNVLISGDQVLPRITTNVGVWGNQPESNPLALFLDSIGRFLPLPADALVLPSHDRVFRGLHGRIAELREHHAVRLERLVEACREPVTAHDVLPVLFKRALDDHQLMFAMGEAIAHLHFLQFRGQLRRETGPDGVRRFARS